MKKVSLFLSVGCLAVASLIVFNNCAKSGFQVGRDVASDDPHTNLGLPDAESIDYVAADQAVSSSMLTADQLLRSMSSLTGVPVDMEVEAEYEKLRSAFGETYDLKKVTAPMLMSMTSLAGVFCNKAVNREAALASGSRVMFKLVDFGKSVSSFNNAPFSDAVSGLSVRFWGRAIKTTESSMIRMGRDEFVQGIVGELTNVQHTKSLAVFLCTGMLSSFDSFSL